MTVSVALLKSYLKIDHASEDDLLAHFIAAAEGWISDQIGKATDHADFQAPPMNQAILQLAAFWHGNREAALVGSHTFEVPFGVRDLIRPYREEWF